MCLCKKRHAIGHGTRRRVSEAVWEFGPLVAGKPGYDFETQRRSLAQAPVQKRPRAGAGVSLFRTGVLVRGDSEFEPLPVRLHLVKRLLERRLLGCGGADARHGLDVLVDVGPLQVGDAEGLPGDVFCAQEGEDALPVARAQRAVRELLDEGHVELEALDEVLETEHNAVVLVCTGEAERLLPHALHLRLDRSEGEVRHGALHPALHAQLEVVQRAPDGVAGAQLLLHQLQVRKLIRRAREEREVFSGGKMRVGSRDVRRGGCGAVDMNGAGEKEEK